MPETVLHLTPHADGASPPLLVMVPPRVAVVAVMPVLVGDVTVGNPGCVVNESCPE